MTLAAEKKVSFEFNGYQLLRAREAAGLSQQQLADRLPFWSQPYICKIESSILKHTISEAEFKAINAALLSS
jgi:transcriptional regulator with XRE-family HTH domain